MEKKSILIVEDEKIAALDLKDTLLSLGYQVTGIASSGERAIELVDTEIPDLILMDIHLSGKLSGIEAAAEILKRHAIPIIYVTAYADPALVEQAKRTRAYGYIIKPYDERAIRTDIEIALYKFGLDQNFRQEYASLEEWVKKRTTELAQANEAFRKSEARWELTFDAVPDMIAIIDGQFRIIQVNKAMADRLGVSKADAIGLTCYEVVHHTKTPVSLCPHQLLIRDGQSHSTDIHEDNLNGDFSLTVSPIRDASGKVIGSVHVLRDITERKKAEDALALASKKLSLLSSITRHDMLNQLTALRTYIELSRGETDIVAVAKYISTEEVIAENLERQIQFAREYQDLGVTSPVWQSIHASIDKAIASLPLRNVTVKRDFADCEIFADLLFEKVFLNLIDNALRYGGDAMTLIRVTLQESENGMNISVEDNGAGISYEDKKRLFQRGFGHHTGLGLFLSRDILAITGITITETGEPGKGARFEITVPKGGFRFTGSK
ncbi:response regulator [uncultured Methanoregula sp.]|uniref:ATP-binding response regulator n=1 Tax=uncultured Methanoregula sp. TaxID=1005933 RepID=UPI002AAB11FB|nr:response regulator [uncultured Methanoregula sp.]